MKVCSFSVFLGAKKRHGGTKRSEQIVEILKKSGIESINPYLTFKKSISLAVKKPFVFIESFCFFSIFL